jgi:glycosyltransferase involved in cell wall biosynthesis
MDEFQVRLVSLIIPIYNEAEHLERFLTLIDTLELPVEKELVLVDDCSKDGSRDILRKFAFSSKVQVIEQEVNRGKGAAIRRGIAAANGDVIGIQDADFEYEPRDIPQLLTRLIEGRSDIVYGSRFKNAEQVHRTLHYLINRILTILSNICSGLYLSDMETCYKFFRADIIKNVKLDSDRFGFEPEVTAKIARLKVRVAELPISYYPRNYLEGKKITWKDGVAALKHILYYSFFVSDRDCFTEALPHRYIPKGGNWL